MSAEEDSRGNQSGRVHVGFATISGSAEKGLRVCLPKSTALEHGFEPGDVCAVKFDVLEQEFVFEQPGEGGE